MSLLYEHIYLREKRRAGEKNKVDSYEKKKMVSVYPGQDGDPNSSYYHRVGGR